jgi:hypothetical protein
MNKMVPVALTFAVIGSAVFAQQVPTDTKILHDASVALENEKAFRGLVITPSVSHGTVTLTGAVSSEGDKVLAGIEVGRVNGVKTVLNNLEVGGASAVNTALVNPNGAQEVALARDITAAFDDPVESTLPVGTVLQISLVDPITTKTAKAGDHFHGTIAGDVSANGQIAIPAGTPVVGRVISAKPIGHFIGGAQLSLELIALQLGQDIGIATETLSSEARGTSPGAAVGALASGPLGLGAISTGAQIELRPATVLRFTLAAPITIAAQ